MDQGDIEQMSFEAALAELEQIVRSLEQGQAPSTSRSSFISAGTG